MRLDTVTMEKLVAAPELCHADILCELVNTPPKPKYFYPGKEDYKKSFKYSWEPSYVFSNFYTPLSVLEIDDKLWRTTEAYYQAQKFLPLYPDYAEMIRETDKPMKAKMLGSQNCDRKFSHNWTLVRGKDHRYVHDIIKQGVDNGVTIREDWEDIKVDVMRKAIEAKFTQIDSLKHALLENVKDNEYLVEDSPRDHFWGTGARGNGLNMLGKCLTSLRWKLKGEKIPSTLIDYTA